MLTRSRLLDRHSRMPKPDDSGQLDLFAPRPPRPVSETPQTSSRPDPASLTDDALIAALPDTGRRDCAALAAEAGRRRLEAAIPALGRLCRRFAGWGADAPVSEQEFALAALVRIGGSTAASIVADGIARAAFIGPTLIVAVAAAASLEAALPEPTLLMLLRHDDARVRAEACRCARMSPAVAEALVALLGDLHHPAVVRAAAIALGRLGRTEARAVLHRLLRDEPAPDIVAALAPIADEEGLVLLRRLAQRAPDLADSVITALETSDHPRAAAIAAAFAVPS
jgi:hypothetical protein